MPDAQPQKRYLANLQGEVDGAAIYTALAESEKDPKLAEVFRRLAAVEQAHGAFWQGRLGSRGSRLRLPAPSAGPASWPGWPAGLARASWFPPWPPLRRAILRPTTTSR